MYMDYYTTGFIIIIVSMLLGLWGQTNVRDTVNKYLKKSGSSDLSGFEVAEKIMHANGVFDVQIELANGTLSDHFDPRSKKVRLSRDIYYGKSIAAQAIAAHEVGHVLQYAEDSSLIKIRTSILPVAQIGSQMSGPLILLGIFASMTGLLWLGIVALVFALLFQLATLPVEFDASNRALKQMYAHGITDNTTDLGAKKVLKAAAWTYVIAALVALLQIIRLVMIARNND